MVINYCPVIVKSTRRHWNIALRIQGQMGFWYSSNLRRLTKIALISWESNDLTAPQRVSLLHSQSELLRVPRLYRNSSQTAGCQNEQSQVKGSVIFTKVDQEYPIYTKEWRSNPLPIQYPTPSANWFQPEQLGQNLKVLGNFQLKSKHYNWILMTTTIRGTPPVSTRQSIESPTAKKLNWNRVSIFWKGFSKESKIIQFLILGNRTSQVK